MRCSNCGEQVSRGSSNCRYCGNALQENVTVRQGKHPVQTIFSIFVFLLDLIVSMMMLTLRIVTNALRSIF
jgi:predicted amidophosphoribosyltransferase